MARKRLSSSDRGRLFALALGLLVGIVAGEHLRTVGALLLAAMVAGIAYAGLRLTATARRFTPVREREPVG